jgi:hypothetical protein
MEQPREVSRALSGVPGEGLHRKGRCRIGRHPALHFLQHGTAGWPRHAFAAELELATRTFEEAERRRLLPGQEGLGDRMGGEEAFQLRRVGAFSPLLPMARSS